MSTEEEEKMPRKLTLEEIKKRRWESRQRLLEEYMRCERQMIIIQQKIVETEGLPERDKTSTRQKHHNLYQLEYQLCEKKKRYSQLQKTIER